MLRQHIPTCLNPLNDHRLTTTLFITISLSTLLYTTNHYSRSNTIRNLSNIRTSTYRNMSTTTTQPTLLKRSEILQPINNSQHTSTIVWHVL